MISIAMAYKNRKMQLIKTLESIESQSYKDIEVIIVDDASDPEQKVADLQLRFPFLTVVTVEANPYKNPCIVYNAAFSMCSGEVVIIQNPECLHVGELIQSVAENIDDSRYLSYACYNLLEKYVEEFYNTENKKDFILSLPQEFNQDNGDEITWYNHSHYRKVDFHFTTAITRKNLESINGFDERYKYGMEFDDNEFLDRIKRKGLEIVNIDDPFSVHQYHQSTYGGCIIDGKYMSYEHLSLINYNIYDQITQNETMYRAPENEYYNCNGN